MEAVGDMRRFTQYQTAQAIRAIPGAGGGEGDGGVVGTAAGAGAGLGAGIGMGAAMVGAMRDVFAPPASAPASVPTTQPPPGPTCSNFQATVPAGAKFCPECGTQLSIGAASLKLIVHSTGGRKQEVPLERSTVILGSGPEATVQLIDSYVSKKHCRLTPTQEGGYELSDVNSANGTFVRLTASVAVEPGTQFLVGSTLVCIEKA